MVDKREARLGWFGHVKKICVSPVRRCERLVIEGKRRGEVNQISIGER